MKNTNSENYEDIKRESQENDNIILQISRKILDFFYKHRRGTALGAAALTSGMAATTITHNVDKKQFENDLKVLVNENGELISAITFDSPISVNTGDPKIDQLYTIAKQSLQDYFNEKISLDELFSSVDNLYQERILSQFCETYGLENYRTNLHIAPQVSTSTDSYDASYYIGFSIGSSSSARSFGEKGELKGAGPYSKIDYSGTNASISSDLKNYLIMRYSSDLNKDVLNTLDINVPSTDKNTDIAKVVDKVLTARANPNKLLEIFSELEVAPIIIDNYNNDDYTH